MSLKKGVFLTIIIEDDQNFTHRITIIIIMGVQAPPGGGNATTQPMTNLRTAANSDKDDDPSALVPIPIATLGSTSIAEHREGRTNVEVVRLRPIHSIFFLVFKRLDR